MSTRTFLSLEPKLTSSVPSCPTPVVVQFVRDAAIEVCENTLTWRYEQDMLRLAPGEYLYDYDTPDDAEVVAVIHAALNGTRFDPLTQEQLHAAYPAWPDIVLDHRAAPRNFSQLDPDHFVVAPVPDAADPYDVKLFLALRPTPTATGMDKTTFDELEDLIVHGALSRLLRLPDKSWTDIPLADYHAKQQTWRTAARRAKANLGAGRASLRVRMVPFS